MSSYFGSGSGASPVSSANSSTVTTPTLFVDSISTANVEQFYALPAGTKQFEVINHSIPNLKLAYTIGDSSILYRILPRGTRISIKNLDSTAVLTLYYQSATTGGRLEVESWV